MQLVIVVENRFARLVSERNAELVLEEGGVDDDGHQCNTEKENSQ